MYGASTATYIAVAKVVAIAIAIAVVVGVAFAIAVVVAVVVAVAIAIAVAAAVTLVYFQAATVISSDKLLQRCRQPGVGFCTWCR